MKTITFKLPEKLAADLDAAAQEDGVSKSQIIRKVLEDRLRSKRGKKSPRAYDLVKDLSGSIKGPADLLTNRKYVRDFGG